MGSKYDTQKGLLSELQWTILRHVCATKEADYKSIGRVTGKARTTIIQSINSLVRHGYIEKIDVGPSGKKYKVVFVPTFRGKSYAWDLARPRMSVNEIFNTETDNDIIAYLETLNQIPEPSQRKPMLFEFASNLLNSPIIDRKGKIRTENKVSSIKQAFEDGLLESIQSTKYNAKDLFNEITLRWLSKFFSTDELEKLKERLITISDNASSTVKLLSRIGA